MIRIERPAEITTPLVFDSPHSGRDYPPDFDHRIDRQILRQAEDSHVEALFAGVVLLGAPLLHALFPRSYIDPNRALEDLDGGMIDGPWPGTTLPGDKTRRGVGLIWRRLRGLGEIYDRRLTVAEVQHRIETCWHPYHAALKELLDTAHGRFGRVWHLNCHSMPAMGDETTPDGPAARADFVLGDRDGSSCDPGFTRFVAAALTDLGYEVKLNEPFKGVELVRRYADPAAGRHSLQIEINRRLYMDEVGLARGPGFGRLRADLDSLTAALARYAKAALGV